MSGATRFTLHHGLFIDGVRHALARVRPLTGADEEHLRDSAGWMSPGDRCDVIISRCIEAIGEIQPVTVDHARSLTIGDREALLLVIHRLTFGDKIESVVTCPSSSCGEKLDIELQASDLLPPPNDAAVQYVEETFSADGRQWSLRFRLPTGADLREAISRAEGDPARGARDLFERCVQSARRGSITASDDRIEWHPIPASSIPEPVADLFSSRVTELDPLSEINLDMRCPFCDHEFQSILDMSAFLQSEIEQRAAGLYHDVHELAFHYHWSESEILAMTAPKRKRYLAMLRAALDEDWR